MSTEFSQQLGHQFAPGHEPTTYERIVMFLASLAPYAGFLVALSLSMIFFVVLRWYLRKRKEAEEKKAKAAGIKPELSAVERAKIAERRRLKKAFDERQEASAKARDELRARHFGSAAS